MPLPTITGVPPEVWDQVLQILQQFGVTVWDLTEQGITTWEGAGGLKEYLLNHGWELKEVWDLKYMWFQTGAGDVTQSNALAQYIANEVTIAGAAGSQYVQHFTYGGSTISKLKKGVVFGSIFALLVSSLDPSFITDALKGRLNEVIDRFADDNDEVPVIVGEDGKTYYHEDMINALRQALIDEGAYDTVSVPDAQYEYTGANGVKAYFNLNFYRKFTRDEIYDELSLISDGQIISRVLADFKQKISSTSKFYGYMYGQTNRLSYQFRRTVVMPTIQYNSSTRHYFTCLFEWAPPYGKTLVSYYYDPTYYTQEQILESFRNAVDSLNPNSPQEAISLSRASWNNYGLGEWSWGGNVVTDQSSSFSTVPYKYVNPIVASEYTSLSSDPLLFGFATSGQGVEGITVASDLIQRGIGDISTSLENVFPSYATDKITTINPTDEDITASENWYPISSSNSDVWTDGITEQQSETATDGEVTPDIQTQLADAIKQILEDYYRDPTDPNVINYPEIETGDSGDTPPENPPLIPPSDVTGSNGLWSIYNPSLQNVNDFGAWLWSDSLADQFKRIFNSPIDGVIGFHMLYCTPSTGTEKPIKCGFLQSPVSAPVVTNPYVEIDCGTVSINEYYRNAMDYDNTRISVYLPFIGIVPLDTNIVMGSDINITYRIDVLTGTCLAQIKVIKENSDAVMYAFDGNCAVQIPLTATTYTGMIGALLGGISAGASIMTGNMVQAIGSGVRALASGMTGLSGAKQSGTFGANVGALGIRIPYVIITHPVSAMPGQFNKLEGIPSNNAVVLGSLSGYTRVRSVHLENIGKATQEEIQMIQEQLEQGVII